MWQTILQAEETRPLPLCQLSSGIQSHSTTPSSSQQTRSQRTAGAGWLVRYTYHVLIHIEKTRRLDSELSIETVNYSKLKVFRAKTVLQLLY